MEKKNDNISNIVIQKRHLLNIKFGRFKTKCLLDTLIKAELPLSVALLAADIKYHTLYRFIKLSDYNKFLKYNKRSIDWRNEVLKRGNYKCFHCGSYNNLQAHHIKSFKFYPKLRFDVNNGIILCKSCHKKTDNYGMRSVSKYKLEHKNEYEI